MSLAAAPHGISTGRQVMLVFGATIGLATGFAGLYFSTLGIFLKPIAADFGWTRADTSAAIIMSMLGLAVGSPLQGLLMDRLNARHVIGGSVVLLALSLLAFSILPDSHVLFGSLSFVMGVLTVASGPNGYLTILPRWFDRRLGLALSCAMIGVGIGAATLPMLAQRIVEASDWRHAYRILAIVVLIGGGAAYLLLAAGEAGAARPGRATRQEVADRPGLTLAQSSRDWRLWVILVALMIGGAAGLGATLHLAAMLGDRGFSPDRIATAVALNGVGLLLGRFGAGVLMDFVRAPLVGAMAYILGATGMALVGLGLVDNFGLIALGAVMIGFALGAEGDFAAFVVRRYFGMRALASTYGCALAAYSLGGVVGPILFGYLFDRHGDYVLATAVAMAGFVTTALMLLTLGRYRFAAAA